MQITTRSRYATRALLEIGLDDSRKPIGIRTIAKRQEIPHKYLESLFKHLRAAGLVRSVRGAGGGYLLARPAREISLWEVVSAMEGKASTIECVRTPDACRRSPRCVTRDVWTRLDQGVTEILGSITVADLVEKHRRIQAVAALDFVI